MIFWPKELLIKLDYSFKNDKLLTQAFLHSSIVNELSFKTESNERLEFLGDSILGLLVSTSLFQDFNDLIGNPPEFQDVDDDGIGEYAVSEGGDKANRVAFENKNGSFKLYIPK